MCLFALSERRTRVLTAMVVAANLVPLLHVAPGIAAVNGAPQLTFPWATQFNPANRDPNGQFNYGPHDWNGSDSDAHFHSWNSLDLAPVGGHVYAARGGTAYSSCTNQMIQIVHGDGYQTTYVHLRNIQIASGQPVTRGTWLADVITDPNFVQDCFFRGVNHVHFSLWYVPLGYALNFSDSQAVDWGGISPTAVAGQPQIGAWTVDDGIPHDGMPGQNYGGCMTPLASPGVRKCGILQSTTTYIFNDSINSQLTVARRPIGGTEDLFVRGTNLHPYWAPTDQFGTPTQAWVDLSAILKGSPTAVWNADLTQLYVFGIGGDDNIYYRTWTPSGWSWPWGVIAYPPGFGISGPALTETVTVDRLPGTPSLDILIRGPAGDVQHASLDPALNPMWGSLDSPNGGGVKGTPSGRWNSQGSRYDVFAIGADDQPWVKSLINGSWTASWSPLTGAPAAASARVSVSGALASINEMVMAVPLPSGGVDLFYRGASDNTVHVYAGINGDFVSADSLSANPLGAPDGMWDASGSRLDAFLVGSDYLGYQYTYSVPTCSTWCLRLLPGGGMAG